MWGADEDIYSMSHLKSISGTDEVSSYESASAKPSIMIRECVIHDSFQGEAQRS